MDYNQTLEYLYNSLPVFQRIGAAAYKANLDNTMALDEHLGHPHRSFATVHIAGTNGKGSVSQMIYEVLRASGYSVGLYTSPHLRDFRERIIVNGQMITQDAVVSFVAQHREFIESLQPSFFEVTVAMAFDYFRREGVDVAVVEVGMGGRLDSTNIITPKLSVITNIDFDHTQFLGSTLPEIAAEKAGIIKAGIPVVVGETDARTAMVFMAKAQAERAPIFFADQRYVCTVQEGRVFHLRSLLEQYDFELQLGMCGTYQRRNICTALTALDELAVAMPAISPQAVREGLSRAVVTGRWQVLATEPMAVCDTAHNVAGMSYVTQQIARQAYDNLYVVLGMVADKDISGVLALLPQKAYYFFTAASIARAMDAEELARIAAEHGLQGEVVTGGVAHALELARERTTPRDMIFIGGSTFVVAEIV